MPIWVFAQEGEIIDIQTSMNLRAEPGNSNLEYWEGAIRQVKILDHLFIPAQRMTLMRVNDYQVEVELSKPFKFRYYEKGEAKEFELARFLLTLEVGDLDRMMALPEGSHFTDPDSKNKKIKKFIQLMEKPKKVTQSMINRFNSGSPSPIFKVTGLHLDIDVLPLLRGEATRSSIVSYSADTILSYRFEELASTRVFRTMSNIGRLVDINSELIEQYLAAVRDLRIRVGKLYNRGWFPGQRDHWSTAFQKTFDTRESAEILRLAPRCYHIY